SSGQPIAEERPSPFAPLERSKSLAVAQATSDRAFAIPPQPLAQALVSFAQQADVQVSTDGAALRNIRSPGVAGRMSTDEALERLLSGTGFAARRGADTITLVRSPVAVSAGQAATSGPEVMGELIVTAGRRGQSIEEIPQAVLVLEEEEIQREVASSTNLTETLGRLIPGFSAPRPIEGGGFGISLRGREPLFLLDGVRLSFNQSFQRFLDTFDGSIIERIEVVYGPTALYGQGATGGVIQFFTRTPSPELFEGEIRGSVRSFIANDNLFDSDGLTFRTSVGATGTYGRLGYVAFGSFEDQGGDLRSDGALIAPSRNNFARDLQGFGKLDFAIDENQSITASGGFYRSRQTDDAFDVRAETDAGGFELGVPNETPFTYADQPRNRFAFANLQYENRDLVGGVGRVQAYYRDNVFQNPGSDIRGAIASGQLPPSFPGLWQTGQDANEIGVRADYTRTFLDRVTLTVGGDYSREDYLNTLLISDPEGFDENGFFDGLVEDVQSPPYVLSAFGLFFQGEVEVVDRLLVSGGVRYDRFSYEVDPYDVVFSFNPPGERPGGDGSADGFSFNGGVAYEVAREATVFANYSQGFQIPEVGQAANQVLAGVPLELSEFIEPIKVESFQAGVRGEIGPVSYSFAGFVSRSDLGVNILIDNSTGLGEITRSPQRNYGVEAAAEWSVTEALTLGAQISWNEGEFDPDDTGNFVPVSSLEVEPIKFTATGNYAVTDDLDVFARVLHLGSRDRAFREGTDRAEPDSYTIVDVGATYRFGPADIGIQVTNLLNEDYSSVFSSAFIPGRRRNGPGRAVWLSGGVRF
ncbi:MAG: TonB-dependent receptor, partial [Pseudomonadota bacterium]